MTTWIEGNLQANGLNIHYYRTGGEGKPKVVFNHGATDNGLCWTPVVRQLEGEYDCILLDARGHGKSDAGGGDYSTAARVADLAGALQALELERPVIGGHSMGADTALHFAITYPERVRAVFLEDPPIIQEGETVFEHRDADDDEEWPQNIMIYRDLSEPEGLGLAQKNNPTYSEDELIPWVQSKRQVSMDFLESLARENIISNKGMSGLMEIGVPSMLFIGDRERMAIVSRDTAEKASRANHHLGYVHIAGAGHSIRRDCFDQYMTALKNFLRKLE